MLGRITRDLVLRVWVCGVALVFACPAAFGSQTRAKAPVSDHQNASLARLEQQASSYRQSIEELPLEVHEVFRQYDSEGKLIRERHRTYTFTLENFSHRTGVKHSVRRVRGNESKGVRVFDTPAFALAMLSQPESHFRLASPAQQNPRRMIFLFQSKPCRKPRVVHGWISVGFRADCFAGDVKLSSTSGILSELTARALRLPVSGRPWPFLKTAVFEALTFRITFHEVSLPHETNPFLVPRTSRYTMRYNNGRTIVADSFEPEGAVR